MNIKCKNMTHALKANKILYGNGIESSVKKISDDPSVRGCVYSISFSDKYAETALDLMYNGGVLLHKSEKNVYGDRMS